MQKRISKQKHDTSMTGKKCNRLKNRNVHGLSKDFLTFTPKRRWTMTLSHLNKTKAVMGLCGVFGLI